MTHSKEMIVISHKNCHDGTASVYALWRKFGDTFDVIYKVPSEEIDIELTRDKTVYFTDCSASLDTFQKIKSIAKRVIVIDHHSAAYPLIPYNDSEGHIEEGVGAGCVLVWRKLFPQEPLPYLFEVISDWDEYKLLLPESKFSNTALTMYPRSFEEWKKLENKEAFVFELEKAKYTESFLEKELMKILPAAYEISYKGIQGIALNTGRLFATKAGNALLKKHPQAQFSLMWSLMAHEKTGEMELRVSLRSDNEKDFDVTQIAKDFPNGGGHFHAAGFITNPETFFRAFPLSKEIKG